MKNLLAILSLCFLGSVFAQSPVIAPKHIPGSGLGGSGTGTGGGAGVGGGIVTGVSGGGRSRFNTDQLRDPGNGGGNTGTGGGGRVNMGLPDFSKGWQLILTNKAGSVEQRHRSGDEPSSGSGNTGTAGLPSSLTPTVFGQSVR